MGRIFLLIAAVAGIVLVWIGYSIVSFDAQMDANGLPRCNSSIATEDATKAIQNAPLASTVHIEIFSFEKIERLKLTDEPTTECSAEVLTNGGRRTLRYTLSRVSGGRIYVQSELAGN